MDTAALKNSFRIEAAAAFSGLHSKYGFSGPEPLEYGICYKKKPVSIEILQIYERHFGIEVGVYLRRFLGLRGSLFTIDYLTMCGGELFDDLDLVTFARDQDAMREALPRWYDVLVRFGEPVLKGDWQYLKRIKVPESVNIRRDRKDAAFDLKNEALGAWHEKRYEDFISMYERLRELQPSGLSPKQEEQLAFAKSQLPKA